MKLDPMKLINVLKDKAINKNDLANTNTELLSQLCNNLEDTKSLIINLNIEQAIKYTLWNGIWNQYGIYGEKREVPRKFKDKTFYDEKYSRGKILSIDFGVSNIGRELSYTHSGIVVSDYTGIVVVIPMTSQKEFKLTHLSPDIQNVVIPIFKKDYPQINEDSYILTHQIRSVSKNRITKIVASISKTPIMKEIEEKLFEIHTPYINKLYNDKINELNKEINNLKNIIDNQNKKIIAYKSVDNL